MNDLSDEQRAAIDRIDSAPDNTPPTERLKLIRGALSVSRKEVETSLTEKNKSKKGRHSKSERDPSASSS
jgi:hypothetical protein